MRLKKNNVYIVRISVAAYDMLRHLGIVDEQYSFLSDIAASSLTTKSEKQAYLRGAFLAGGSMNHPDTSYHLEIFSLYEEHSAAILAIMSSFSLHAKMLQRKKGFILYLKEGEKISDFLGLIGAHHALLQFEDVRIMKDMRNSVNRIVNCDTANLNKTVGASMRQVEDIRLIETELGMDALPDKLREIAELRLAYQDINLTELGEKVTSGKISKSGINHRFRKISNIADKLKRGESVSL